MTELRIGSIIHGFCYGAFGRDSFGCRRVEAIGADWVVTRNRSGVELGRDLDSIAAGANDRSYCDDECEGP